VTAPAGIRTVLVCLVLAASAAPAAVPPVTADGGAAPALAPEDVDPDTVRILVSVREDGTADWRVAYRIELDDDNRTAAFESLEEDVEDDTAAYEAEFRELMQPSVAAARSETGREMAVRNVSVETKREFAPPTGVVAYELEWTAFAAVEDGQLRVGDAISGFYVSEETILRVEWPDGYELAAVTPAPDGRSSGGVAWRGRTAFGSDEPRLTVAPAGGTDGTPLPLSVAALAALALLTTLGLVGRVRSRSSGEASAAPADGSADAASADAATGTGAADAAAAEAKASATGVAGGAPPEELLSNEERVIAALQNHGGRMKQQELADRLDWGAPKTSRVVGSLRDDEAVEVFRLGRENVVTLPEEDLLS
jgi:uncharacterized membrane protein